MNRRMAGQQWVLLMIPNFWVFLGRLLIRIWIWFSRWLRLINVIRRNIFPNRVAILNKYQLSKTKNNWIFWLRTLISWRFKKVICRTIFKFWRLVKLPFWSKNCSILIKSRFKYLLKMVLPNPLRRPKSFWNIELDLLGRFWRLESAAMGLNTYQIWIMGL